MDNKLKFSDRIKALMKTEARQDVDPYIFNEPEPIDGSSNQHHFSMVLHQNSNMMPACKNNKTKVKCVEKKFRIAPMFNSRHKIIENPNTLANNEQNRGKNLDYRISNKFVEKQCPQRNLQRLKSKRPSRDHTLLYYPRAGEEVSDSESSGDEMTIYQRHWFTGEVSPTLNRATRLSQLRSQLRRRLIQLHRSEPDSEGLLQNKAKCLLDAACKDPESTARALNDSSRTNKLLAGPLLVGAPCLAKGCKQTSLPCTRHCSHHIMLNTDQLLFEHCTAKFSDNTQCCIPVFDVIHELPLCPEHARKRDNYHRKAQESKPKKARKKPTSPSISRPKSKSKPKKRKRPVVYKTENKELSMVNDECQYFTHINSHENHIRTLNNLNMPQGGSNSSTLNLGLGLGALGLDGHGGGVPSSDGNCVGAGTPGGGGGGSLKVELADHEVFAALDSAEHDFGNVLNNLPADAFNDLFIESRNGEYEPSREEEEELERALEAVDKDVRNLERMGQTHGLLEPALLAQLMSDIAS